VRLRTIQFSPGPSENAYRISVAVAGFTEAELSIESKENRLTIRGKKQTSDEEKTGDVALPGHCRANLRTYLPVRRLCQGQGREASSLSDLADYTRGGVLWRN
jgi:hypothetical protein